jgi:hypothetical protein
MLGLKIYLYSRTPLYRSSGDRRDNFDITEVRYNRYGGVTAQLAGTWERLLNNREFDISEFDIVRFDCM